MRINAKSLKCYIFCVVALCGQVKRTEVSALTDSPAYARRVTKELIDDGLLTSKSIDRARMLRIKAPLGLEMLEEIPILKNHYMTITGGHHFATSSADKTRNRNTSKIHMMCIQNEIKINGIRLTLTERENKDTFHPLIEKYPELEKNIDGYGSITADDAKTRIRISMLKDMETVEEPEDKAIFYADKLRQGQLSAGNYYPSAEVKKDENGGSNSPTLRINPSRMCGHLIGNYESHVLYFISADMSKSLDPSTEKRIRTYLERKYKEVYGKEAFIKRKEIMPDGSCIIMYETEELLMDYVNDSIDDLRKQNNLTKIYSKCFAVSAEDENLMKLLVKKDWQNALCSRLFTFCQREAVEKRKINWCDAIVEEVPAIELISMDLAKISITKRALKGKKSLKLIAVCKENQKELIKKIYGECAAQVNIICCNILE